MFGLIAGGLAVGTVLAGPASAPPSGMWMGSPCVYVRHLHGGASSQVYGWAPPARRQVLAVALREGTARSHWRPPERSADFVQDVRDRRAWRATDGTCPAGSTPEPPEPPEAPRKKENSKGATNKQAPQRNEAPRGNQAPQRNQASQRNEAPQRKQAKKRPVKKQAAKRRSRKPGAIAAAAALRWLGTPYSWGGGAASGPTRGIGRGARTRGFDCSGLVLHAWAKAGVKLGHYTGTQFKQGRRVRKLRRGDLVFFGGGMGDPTHVGLYLSRGIMVHAPKTGDVVRKTRFRGSSYYMARYRGAVRPKG